MTYHRKQTFEEALQSCYTSASEAAGIRDRWEVLQRFEGHGTARLVCKAGRWYIHVELARHALLDWEAAIVRFGTKPIHIREAATC